MKIKQSEHNTQMAIGKILLLKKWLVVRINSGAIKIDNVRFVRFYTIMNNGKSAGLPDLIAFKGSQYLLIEVKRSKGKLSDSQKSFIELANNYNIQVVIADNWEIVYDIVNKL